MSNVLLLASESCVYDEKSNNPRPELLPYQIIVLMVNDVKEYYKIEESLLNETFGSDLFLCNTLQHVYE